MTFTVDSVTERQLAKTIDHSLLKPELDDAYVEAGCRLAAEYDVASACVRPVDVKRAVSILDGTDVAVGTVVGFPHGSSTTATACTSAACCRVASGGRSRGFQASARRRGTGSSPRCGGPATTGT